MVCVSHTQQLVVKKKMLGCVNSYNHFNQIVKLANADRKI